MAEPETVQAPPAATPAPAATLAPAADPTLAYAGPAATVGAGVALILASIGTFVARDAALSDRDQLCPDAVCPGAGQLELAESRHGEAESLNTATNALLIAGGLVAAGGAAWFVATWLLSRSDGGSMAWLRLRPTGIDLRGSF